MAACLEFRVDLCHFVDLEMDIDSLNKKILVSLVTELSKETGLDPIMVITRSKSPPKASRHRDGIRINEIMFSFD